MDFRILGPLEVRGERPVVVTAPRQQIVLAVMLLEANHVLPVNRLVDAVWEESPPSTARGQIHICISALRHALADAGLPGLIDTRPPGYRLAVEDGRLDLQVFDNLAAEGRAAHATGDLPGAATAFRQAVGLWGGEPLPGLTSRVVRTAAVKVTERYINLLEECIDVELELGLHQDLTSELTGLVAEYPLRERFWAQLVLALHQAGRRADALAAYRAARQTLAEELGLEPSELLRGLERAILHDDAGLRLVDMSAGESTRWADPVPPPTPQMLPADISDFTDHHGLVEWVHGQLCGSPRATSNVPKVVMITGRGGVGKTASAVHIAHLLLPEYPDGQLFAQFDGDTHADDQSHTLQQFLQALGVAGSAIPETPDERGAMFRSLIVGRRMLVVLDGVVDERQIAPFLPGSPSSGVLVTSRTRLTGIPGAVIADIDVLDRHNALELLAKIVGESRVSTEPTAALHLVDLCGRLPLAIRVAGARLAARPHWTIGQLTYRLTDEARRLDELAHGSLSVTATIASSCEHLDGDARKLLWRLGILESADFAGWVAAPLLDLDPLTAADVLDRLVDARLVDVVSGTGDATRYRLHPLIRIYARDRLAPTEAIHGTTEVLHRTFGAWLHLAEAARSRSPGGDRAVVHSAAVRWRLPDQLVARLLADPLTWYARERPALVAAVIHAARSGAVEHSWDLAGTLVSLFEAGNDLDGWRRTHEVALQAARHAQDRRGEAAMLYSLGRLYLAEHRLDEAEVRLTLAVRVFADIGEMQAHTSALRNLASLDRLRDGIDIPVPRQQDTPVDLPLDHCHRG